MDWQIVINIGATVVLGVVGWFVRDQMAKQERTATALTDLRLKVAQDYVTHAHLRDIKDTLMRMEAKLDAKADK